MDYVVGSVAALISGNVTPNRPRLIRRALTPTKHPQSPNVTPKSEAVDDRSIFLSPTLQKKKAIVKKSPKRIFQNPDLDATNEENNSSLASPKAEKVKKHLKDELESENMPKKSPVSNKSPKNKRDRISESDVPEVKEKAAMDLNLQVENESTPKKKKKKNRNSLSEPLEGVNELNEAQNNETSENNLDTLSSTAKTPKKMKQRRKSTFEDSHSMETDNLTNTELTKTFETDVTTKSPKKKNKNNQTAVETQNSIDNNENKKEQVSPSKKKKNNKRKKKSKAQNLAEAAQDHETDKENENSVFTDEQKQKRKKKSKDKNTVSVETDKSLEQIEVKNKKSKKPVVNPNAITDRDSDSEHDSDDEIESENEQINKKVLETGPADSSSDEEEEKENPKEPERKVEKSHENDAEILKRTLFVGNVPFSNKCKKEIKKIFNKYGQIETIRIRTVPVKDARTTPKLAVIKKELHPERSTVNVYIKYADPNSVEKALVENNTVLNEHHLRVTRSESTGAEHDPRCSVFVGNLPFALEDEVFRAKFEKCGEIDSVRIIRDKKTNAGKGFGYINFKSKDGVELALALTEEDLTIKNRILRVKRCTQTAQRGKQQPHQRREFKKFGKDQVKPGQGQKEDGAFRRILHKRKNQEGGGDVPPNKRQKNLGQPIKEKKPRKEFVGMTAEKKKKRKFDKGQKKKKSLSEILTK